MLWHSGLADSYSLLGELSYAPPREVFPQARVYAEKALTMDETLAEAHLSLGIVKLFYEWDMPGAEKELRRAKELSPNNADVYHFYGHYLELAGRFREAIDEKTKRGVELNPTSSIINAELGFAFYVTRKYDEAIEQARKTLELDPNAVYASWLISQVYEQQGKYQDALEELNKSKDISGNWSWIIAERGYVYAAVGRQAEARQIIQELNDRATREYLDPVLIALIYLALDQKDQALALLEKAYEQRSGQILWLNIEPKFDPLRGDPRFTELVLRVRLGPPKEASPKL